MSFSLRILALYFVLTFLIPTADAQTPIGSIVVDEDGKPIENVSINLMYFPKNKEDADLFRTRTDAEGRWSFSHFSAANSFPHLLAFGQVFPYIELSKEGFLPLTINDLPADRFYSDADGVFRYKIVMEKGYSLTGKVVDETGTPIEGATIQLGETDDIEPVFSDSAGNFRVEHLPLAELVVLSVQAAGKAPRILMTPIQSDNEPLNIVMKPGRIVVFNVTDSLDRPIKGAHFNVNHIDGLPGNRAFFNEVRDHFFREDDESNAQGLFYWNDAPNTPVDLKCWLFGYEEVAFSVKPEQDLVSITLQRSPVREPLGNSTASNEPSKPAPPTVPEEQTPEEQTPEEQTPYPAAGGTILAPDGKPAAGAVVSVFIEGNNEDASETEADAQGVFQFSEEQRKFIGSKDFSVAVVFPPYLRMLTDEEFRQYDTKINAEAEPIRLKTWGRIEGTFQVGAKKWEAVYLNFTHIQLGKTPLVFFGMRRVQTKKKGHFFVEQVIPGKYIVRKDFYPSSNSVSKGFSYCGTIEVLPGKTTTLKLGGTGRAVIGKAVIPESVRFAAYTARIVKKSEEFPRFCVLQRDGTFRFDDLLPGEYTLVISTKGDDAMDFKSDDWHYQGTFTVDDADTASPIDLGELDLEKE